MTNFHHGVEGYLAVCDKGTWNVDNTVTQETSIVESITWMYNILKLVI